MMMLRRQFLAASTAWAFGPDDRDVWRAGEGGCHTYRIPAIVRTRKNTLIAFCEGRRGSGGDAGDIDLLFRRSTDHGKTWGDSVMLADFGSDTVGNPAPVVDRRDGAIHLLLTRNPGNATEKQIIEQTASGTRTVWATVSRDDGRTWETPRDITADTKPPDWTWYATGPCNGIQLRSGRLVIPCDHIRRDKSMWSHVVYSDDHGNTWRTGGSVGPECNESTVVELPDGSLLINMRSYSNRHRRAISLSRDQGMTWRTVDFDAALIEPICQASLIRVNKLLVFSNPSAEKRTNMTVKALRLSKGGADSWGVLATVHPGPSAYSNLVDLGGGRIGLLYERGIKSPYEAIAWTTLSLKGRER